MCVCIISLVSSVNVSVQQSSDVYLAKKVSLDTKDFLGSRAVDKSEISLPIFAHRKRKFSLISVTLPHLCFCAVY